MSKVIFVDRDGVINADLWGYVKRPEDFKFIDGALDSLVKLTDAGYEILVVSNQAGVGDGEFTPQELDKVTEHMMKEVMIHGGRIAGVFYCMHGKNEGCTCRKPETGLFEKAAQAYSFDPQKTFYIGDKISDVEVANRMNLLSAMVKTGYGTRDLEKITDDCRPTFVADDLRQAVDMILEKDK